MEYLTKEYWEMIHIGENSNRGVGFEELVRDLLIAEYGNTAFQNTKRSWDGSKDFFYYSREKNFWAECKNYTSRIDLKVLASTIIMAQLSEIDTVLFYSYSSINTNTKSKLLINAEKKGEKIYFYDDIVLERKIFQHWDYVGVKYFHGFPYMKFPPAQSTQTFEAKCLLFGNPLDTSSTTEGYELQHLTLFKMFEMNICVINKDSNYNKINLGFKKSEQVKRDFEVYPEYIFKSKVEISLSPYEGKNIRIWFIPIKENCTIPHPYINSKKLSLPKNVEFKVLKVKDKNTRRLIGQSYEQCLVDFKHNVLFENNRFKMGVFYGSSGTGKSKLYEECLNLSKMNGYEIINFCSAINAEKSMSIQDFIQKLLIAIYDISLDALEDIFKSLVFNVNDFPSFLQTEYHMLIDIFNAKDENAIEKWIEQYLQLLILKFAKSKFIIAVDNIQFFNDSILDLIDNIYNQLNNIKPCCTKFLLTFNLDYIKRNSKADILLGNCTSNHTVSLVRHIKGFENPKECYEFLQEVFSIGDIFHEIEIKRIAENLNKNPFYLEQMIYWLQDKHVIERAGNQYSVNNILLLKTLIRNIPNNVYDILEERWTHYKKQSDTNFEKAEILFSAIHLYKELEKKEIDDLHISWDTVKELEKIGFIITEDSFNTIIIKFRHDLIDKFFSKMYNSFSKKIINYENQLNLRLRNTELRYYLGLLYAANAECNLSNSQFSMSLTLQIDGRLAYEFYLLVFEKCFFSFDYNYPKDKIGWIKNMHQIIILIHDVLGNVIMKKCVDRLLFKLKNVNGIFLYVEYGKLLLYVSEAFDSMGNYQEATRLIKEYKEKAFEEDDISIYTLEQNKLLSEIYNRLHVYCRHQILIPLENKEVMDYLNISAKIADDILDPVMQYVNYSDKGYLYYDLPLSDERHNNTVDCWMNACKIYENGGVEEKELNYLRKKVQLALLEGDTEKAVQAAETGLIQIDFSPHAYQQSFFKWWFYHALAEGYLLNYDVKNIVAIEDALDRAQFYSELLNSNKKFYYLQLRSVYLYYLGKTDKAIILNREALELVKDSNYIMKKRSIKRQLLENNESFCENLLNPKRELSSQIHTIDWLFNLPCI